MAAAGLLEVARGAEHPSFNELSLKPMDLLPPLPPNTSPAYAKILEMHVSWAAHNRKVESHKATMQLTYADQVYASIEGRGCTTTRKPTRFSSGHGFEFSRIPYAWESSSGLPVELADRLTRARANRTELDTRTRTR